MAEYLVIGRQPENRLAVTPTRVRVARFGRGASLEDSATQAENRLEGSGIFKWYRDVARKRDPLAQRKGRPHPFGAAPLELTGQQAAELRKKFPDAALIRNARVHLIRSARVLGTVTGAVATADLWHLDRIGVLPLRLRTGLGATVAVVDTGVQTGHPEFAALPQPIESFGFHPDTGAAIAAGPDTAGHGTHIAGLICGRTCGVAPGAKLINIKVFGSVAPTLRALLAALTFVAAHPEIDIVNLSLGITDRERALGAVIGDLLFHGILPVCAVGNAGAGRAESPGDFDGAMTVGFTNKLGMVETNSGSKTVMANGVGFDVPDLVAPGAQVVSARAGGGFEQRSGSSMAAAIVSGLAALQVEQNPSIGADALASSLLANVVPVAGLSVRSGHGFAVV